MTRERQAAIWVILLAVFLGFIFLTSSILLPFVAGIGVAYFLDPLADRLEEWGASRLVATIIITVFFFVLMVLLLVLLVPLLQSQLVAFVAKLPSLIQTIAGWLAPLQERVEGLIAAGKLEQLRDAAQSFSGNVVAWFGRLIGRVLQGGAAFLNLVSLIVITPIVSFYMLRDWDRIVAKLDSWLPRRSADNIRQIFRDIDVTIAGFVRGQGTVCVFLAVFYGVGLSLIGLEFGLTIGLATGLISFIPYFGMFVGMATAFAVAFAQFSDFLPFVMVFAVFMAGQGIESMFLTPKLVGDRVGLHPVWVIFALLAGGAIFGFTGVLLAVPVAATIGVLVRFFLDQYLDSHLYHSGQGKRDDGDKGPDG